jgi:D-inositol-3-phosphate glycosyltransferase
MKLDLLNQFGVAEKNVSVIPFGINNSAPSTALTPATARKHLGIADDEKAILFFGNIAPYKGLDYLVAAFRQLLPADETYRLIIAGWPKNCESYWAALKNVIETQIPKDRVLLRAEFVPDDETELYFKAADVLVLPYKHIYQSGVLFLSHSFGLPVLAADVGSLKDEVVEGETGFVFPPENPAAIVKSIERYFASELFASLNSRRPIVRAHALERHSWDVVGGATVAVYAALLKS